MLTETFIRQMITDTSIRRVKILFPAKLSVRGKMMNGLSLNEHIKEISIMYNKEDLSLYPTPQT